MPKATAPAVIAVNLEIFFMDVLRRGEIADIHDVCEVIRPEVEREMRRVTRENGWTLRSDFLFNTLRLMAKKEGGIALAICGDAVWLMDKAPAVTKRFERPERRASRRRKK